jgi:hypothetical protein
VSARGQLEAGGVKGDDGGAEVDVEAGAVAARLDALLERRCAGEAKDGTVVARPETCTGAYDAAQVTRLLERANRDRFQVWRWLAEKRGGNLPEAQRAWRAVHLESVVCGAPVERDDGTWEAKAC